MPDFDEKLNNLLSNPEAMGQIMQLAHSLGSNMDSSSQQQFSSDPPLTSSKPQYRADYSPDNNLFGSVDVSTLMRLLPLVQEIGEQNGNIRALLLALRPYLKTERQGKIEQALQLARLICIGKKFLINREE